MPGFRVFRSLDETPPDFGPSALTIGNFDGLHAGHRIILRRVVEIGRANGWKPSVLTFEPHPTKVVAPARAPRLLTTPDQRCELMRAEGIEQVLVLPFTEELSKLTPEEFVQQILFYRAKARAVLVGDNFRFGAKQAGDVLTLRELGTKYGYETYVLTGVRRHGRMVSSSGVRKLIQEGEISLAARFLERPYTIEGDIVPGHGIGSKQTVPTLNLATRAEVLPANGVYITRTYDLDAPRQWDSITNIGYRPTFGGDALTIETFLLDPLEGETPRWIRLEFLRRVREERKFESPDALRSQIMQDVSRAKAFFRRCRRWTRITTLSSRADMDNSPSTHPYSTRRSNS
jgi:riboflavin kinase / FMN adenylyltransferase